MARSTEGALLGLAEGHFAAPSPASRTQPSLPTLQPDDTIAVPHPGCQCVPPTWLVLFSTLAHVLFGKFHFLLQVQLSAPLLDQLHLPPPLTSEPAQPQSPQESLPSPFAAPTVVGDSLCYSFITGGFCRTPLPGCNPLKVGGTIPFILLSAQHPRLPGA